MMIGSDEFIFDSFNEIIFVRQFSMIVELIESSFLSRQVFTDRGTKRATNSRKIGGGGGPTQKKSKKV